MAPFLLGVSVNLIFWIYGCLGLDTHVECKIRDGGKFTVNVQHKWAPNGAQRFIDLVNDNFYDGAALFRCQKDITVQFGIPESREKMKKWFDIGNIKDDIKRSDLFQQSHWKKGLISFAGGGPNSRGAQIFVTLNDDIPQLGGELWETPFAEVIEGLDVWKNDVYFGYGDKGGPQQGKLFAPNAYTEYLKEFPKLSYMEYCNVLHHEEHHDEIGHIMALEIGQICFVLVFVICIVGGAVLFQNRKNMDGTPKNDWQKLS